MSATNIETRKKRVGVRGQREGEGGGVVGRGRSVVVARDCRVPRVD